MKDKWPKLLITSNTVTGISYTHLASLEELHIICLNILANDITTGYYEYDTFKGTFADYLNEKYKNITPEMTDHLVANNFNFLQNDLMDYNIHSHRQVLLEDAIKAVENDDGALAVSVLERYDELYQNDFAGKDGFQVVDYA